MYRHRYHILLLLLLTALLPATLLAKKKKVTMEENALLSLDEQHYFDSLYFLAISLDERNLSDSAMALMTQATNYYDSAVIANGYEIKITLPSAEKEVKKGKSKKVKTLSSKQVPGLAAAYFFLYKGYRQQNNAMQSVLAIERAVTIDSVNYWYTEAEGDLFAAMKQYDDARICYERLVRQYPDKVEPLYGMSDIYLRLDSVNLCLKTLDKLEELDGINPQLTQYKFAILHDNGRTEEGFDQYRKLIARYPYNVQYRITMGDLQMQNGQIPQAKQTYDAAAAIEPDNAYVWVAQANYYSVTGDQEAADKLVASALTNANLDVDTKVKVMEEYLRGSFRKLSQYREEVAKGNVTTQLDTMALFSNVDSLFSDVARMHPTADAVYELQSEWRSAMGQDSLASESMRFAVDLKPTSEEYWEKLMVSATTWMSKDQLIELTHEALAQDSTMQTAYLVAAWAYVKDDDYELAITCYLQAIEHMTPPDANKVSTLWGNIGDIYYQMKRLDKAYECYDKAIKYNPTNYSALNNYAYYLSQEKRDLTKAEQMSLKVIQQYPDNPTYLDTYAWILYLEGSCAIAIFYQQHAIDCLNGSDTNNCTLFDHYGDMLVKNNDLKGAVEQWKRALQCTDCEEPESIQKKIDNAEALLQ